MGGQKKQKPFGISRHKKHMQGLIGILKIKYFLPYLSRVIMGAQTEAMELWGRGQNHNLLGFLNIKCIFNVGMVFIDITLFTKS